MMYGCVSLSLSIYLSLYESIGMFAISLLLKGYRERIVDILKQIYGRERVVKGRKERVNVGKKGYKEGRSNQSSLN